jgi:hypothetical protein
VIVRAAFAILLVASGCDALFGLREVPADPDARHDGKLDAKAVSDAPNDTATTGCAGDGLTCGTVALYKTTAGCYAACRDQINYGAAITRCQAWGGALAAFSVAGDDQLLQVVMTDTTVYWMGMTQGTLATDPALGWSWNNGQTVTNARWYTSNPLGMPQPDDGDTLENGQEQCGWYSTLGWGDGDCNAGFQFLCKK